MNYKDKKWLEEKYYVEQLGTPEIARLSGCAIGTIQYWMRKHEIKMRSSSEAHSIVCRKREEGQLYINQDWLREKYHNEQLNIYEMGKIANCGGVTILRWMDHYGIERRSKSEAGKKSWEQDDGARAEAIAAGVQRAKDAGVYDDGWKISISRKAKERWDSGHYSGHNHPRWNSELTKCDGCGADLWVPPAKMERSEKHFCNINCYGTWISKNNCGENHFAWLGGKSFEPYPATFNGAFKRMIRERDSYKCAICRLPGKCVHHINYIKDDTVPENCIVLCRKCHLRTNGHRDYWQVALTNLIQARGRNEEVFDSGIDDCSSSWLWE